MTSFMHKFLWGSLDHGLLLLFGHVTHLTSVALETVWFRPANDSWVWPAADGLVPVSPSVLAVIYIHAQWKQTNKEKKPSFLWRSSSKLTSLKCIQCWCQVLGTQCASLQTCSYCTALLKQRNLLAPSKSLTEIGQLTSDLHWSTESMQVRISVLIFGTRSH